MLRAAAIVVLGSSSFMPSGTGWGTERPAEIYNGGVPSGQVTDIVWRRWGGKEARGSGWVWQYKPGGGYYGKRVRVRLRASRIVTCPGSDAPAYTRLIARAQAAPGGPWEDFWFPWFHSGGNICTRDAAPARCAPVEAAGRHDRATKIEAYDVPCAKARALARAVVRRPRARPRHGPSVTVYRYKLRVAGFACSGYDGYPDGYAWTCRRGAATVDFRQVPAGR